MHTSISQEQAEVSGGGGCSWSLSYESIISVENLLEAWKEFIKGKHKRVDVQEFGRYLMHNVLELHRELSVGTYRHGGYHHFRIADPKPRDIHKASVRDRLVHHAIYRVLYPFFNRTFVADSYSCRIGKGTHKAMNRFREFACKVSKNDTRTCWVLKCDIRKFFASIDQRVLMEIIDAYILDDRIRALIGNIISSFNSGAIGKGLPLGNLTSQLLVNVYMNEFDQFVKHKLKTKHYIRYSDDFVTLSSSRDELLKILPYMEVFLRDRLKLSLHPDKVSIETLASGVDFLGWVHFPDHRVLRTSTKRRMLKALSGNPKEETAMSYRGMLSHGNAHKLSKMIPYVVRNR
jgi:retron-type reverse transcriptase